MIDGIDSPEDLKRLPRAALPQVAEEIRRLIIETVSKTGGHLAPSLGVVELAIAIHYVFDTPADRLIWDVGHQSYAHKIICGRRDRFSTLRQDGGLSGFTRKSESPYDPFSTGHSSTSISAGLGMASANALSGDGRKVIAVIGDGSMTAGLAYEGLNQAGDLKKDLLVILNDNDMSISPNVGALSSFLSRKFSHKGFLGLRKDLKNLLRPRPGLYHFAKRLEDTAKAFMTPGMLFEAFDFNYYGPIDGHRLDYLIDTLENVRQLETPVLLHVSTTKGKGYLPAERNPSYFHGVGCFEVATGNCVDRKAAPTYTSVFGDTIRELARTNDGIVAVTAAMPEGTGLKDFGDEHPERFFDVGIAEQHGVTFAAGMAAEGYHPVVAIYSTFLQRAYDQVLHDVCLESLPVVFAMDRGGIVGEDGPTHHGVFDLSYLRSMPNMVVMAPMDEEELRHMLATAVNHDGPAAVRYPRGSVSGVPPEGRPTPLPLGKAVVLAEGDDVAILALGRMVNEAMQARDVLLERGISATVVNCRFVKPLDAELIVSLARGVKKVVTAEEGVLMGGFGSAVLEALCDAGVHDVAVKRVGIPDRFVEHGPPALLRERYGLDARGITEAALTLFDHPGSGSAGGADNG
ncbi:MAG: 1-deoxy-D-xylulose-5-phosphate synthase [Desulfatibacillaceae bacterium]